MSGFNYIFFEEYKSLDRLCGQLYDMQYGITTYIENMKKIPQNCYQNVPNWNNSLRELIRIRHIRNHLAHEEGAFEKENCTQRDIEWIQNFHNRILNQSDPLAVLRQVMRTENQKRNQLYINNQQKQNEKFFQNYLPNKRVEVRIYSTNDSKPKIADKGYKRKSFFWWGIIAVVAAVGVILKIIEIVQFYM